MHRITRLSTVGAFAIAAAFAASAFADDPKPAAPAAPAAPATPSGKSPGQVFIPPESKGKVVPIPVPVEAKKPTVAQPTGAVTPLAEALQLTEKNFDWGDIADTEPVEHVIVFKNTAPTKIKVSAQASCGCTVTTMSKNDFDAGEEGKVTARFDPHGRSGTQSKTITFTIQEPANTYSMQSVNLTANVKALVSFDPVRLFSNDVDHREGKAEKLTITGRKPGFAVLSAESSSEFVKVKVLESKVVDSGSEKVTQVPVELLVGKGAPIGKFDASITFTTNDDRAKPQPYFLGADVVGDVKVTPPQAIARVNTPNTSFSSEMRLDSRTGTAFKITSVDVEARKDMQVVADIKPGDGGKYYMLSISGVTPNEQGMFTGYIVITTDGNGNETLRIPFSAAVSRPISSTAPAMGQTTPPSAGH